MAAAAAITTQAVQNNTNVPYPQWTSTECIQDNPTRLGIVVQKQILEAATVIVRNGTSLAQNLTGNDPGEGGLTSVSTTLDLRLAGP